MENADVVIVGSSVAGLMTGNNCPPCK